MLASKLETVKYWAGQKLLHSPLHPYYLRITGNVPKPCTYARFIDAEALDPADRALNTPLPPGFKLVLPEGAHLAPDAAFWLSQAAVQSDADLIYADEDVEAGAPSGTRGQPVFKPAWSPELFAHCDYLGGAYLIREGIDLANLKGRTIVHVPRVLFHRNAPAEYPLRDAAPTQSPQQRPQSPPPQNITSSLVSIIICSRNPVLVAECLQSIRSKTAYKTYEIVLIDHRAGMAAVAERFGVAQHIRYEEDFNFARMCNAGVRASRGELLLFLNDDTLALDENWLGLMAAQADRRETGAVGALLRYPDGRIQHAGIYVGTSNGAGHPGRLSHGTPMWPWLTMTREQSAVTGACLMMRREVFLEIGGFDETFPVNYNDTDLCLRCGKAGYKVILEARALVEHRESTTRETGIRYGERRRFLDRWGALIDRGDRYWNPNLTDNELLLPDPEAFARVHRWR